MPDDDADDGDLLRAIAAGDRDALARLYARHAPRARRLAARQVDAATAEDVVQAAFLALPRLARGWRGGAPRAWLFTLVINACRNAARAARTRRAHERRWASDAPLRVEADTSSDTAEIVARHLSTLPRAEREAVWLRYGEGLSAAEASQALGRKEATVRSHAFRGLARLRASLTRDGLGAGSLAALLAVPADEMTRVPRTLPWAATPRVAWWSAAGITISVALAVAAVVVADRGDHRRGADAPPGADAPAADALDERIVVRLAGARLPEAMDAIVGALTEHGRRIRWSAAAWRNDERRWAGATWPAGAAPVAPARARDVLDAVGAQLGLRWRASDGVVAFWIEASEDELAALPARLDAGAGGDAAALTRLAEGGDPRVLRALILAAAGGGDARGAATSALASSGIGLFADAGIDPGRAPHVLVLRGDADIAAALARYAVAGEDPQLLRACGLLGVAAAAPALAARCATPPPGDDAAEWRRGIVVDALAALGDRSVLARLPADDEALLGLRARLGDATARDAIVARYFAPRAAPATPPVPAPIDDNEVQSTFIAADPTDVALGAAACALVGTDPALDTRLVASLAGPVGSEWTRGALVRTLAAARAPGVGEASATAWLAGLQPENELLGAAATAREPRADAQLLALIDARERRAPIAAAALAARGGARWPGAVAAIARGDVDAAAVVAAGDDEEALQALAATVLTADPAARWTSPLAPAAVAARDGAVVAALERDAAAADAGVRAAALRVLPRWRARRALELLAHAIERDADDACVAAAARAAGEALAGGYDMLQRGRRMNLDDPAWAHRFGAAVAARIGQERSPWLRGALLQAGLHDAAVLDQAIALATRDDNPFVRAVALSALAGVESAAGGPYRRADVVATQLAALGDGDARVRRLAAVVAHGLSFAADVTAEQKGRLVDALIATLDDGDAAVRREAVNALHRFAQCDAWQQRVRQRLEQARDGDADAAVRRQAEHALGEDFHFGVTIPLIEPQEFDLQPSPHGG